MIPVPSGVRVWIATGHTDWAGPVRGGQIRFPHRKSQPMPDDTALALYSSSVRFHPQDTRIKSILKLDNHSKPLVVAMMKHIMRYLKIWSLSKKGSRLLGFGIMNQIAGKIFAK